MAAGASPPLLPGKDGTRPPWIRAFAARPRRRKGDGVSWKRDRGLRPPGSRNRYLVEGGSEALKALGELGSRST